MNTTLAKKEEHQADQKRWFLFDASEQTLGRMAVQIANILRGRHRATYTPHVDTGDFVIVVNAAKVRVSGNKDEKEYMFYSGFLGNERYQKLKEFRKKNARFIIEHAVKGMLPKNKLANQMIKKLKVYSGENHQHEAQKPIKFQA